MQTWLLIIVTAQLLYAVTAIVDKFIVTSKKVSKPFVYAFYVTLLYVLPIGLFLLTPFELNFFGYYLPSYDNVHQPTLYLLSLSLVAAFTGFHGLVSMYSALREADASDVIPVIGSISAIGTILLNFLVVDNFMSDLSTNFMIAIAFLIVGTIFISHLRFNRDLFSLTLHSGILFAIKATVIKKMFIDTSFDQAFFWSRIGIVIFIISLILIPRYLGKISFNLKKTKSSGGFWVIGNAILGGVAGFMSLKALELGNVTIIQAMSGLQFIFLFIISLLFGRLTPKEFGENDVSKDIIQKFISIFLIAIGFYFLFV